MFAFKFSEAQVSIEMLKVKYKYVTAVNFYHYFYER